MLELIVLGQIPGTEIYVSFTDSNLARFSKRLAELSSQVATDNNKQYLLEELRLYAESIVPEL